MGAADGVAAVPDKRDWPFQLQKQLGHSVKSVPFPVWQNYFSNKYLYDSKYSVSSHMYFKY